jgi:hypothetical protein
MSGSSKLSYPEYEAYLKPLLKELAQMSRWVSETRQRIVVVFEGRDTAGKGGSIDMIARVLNPRQCRVAALPSPTEREREQWYFQRYIPHLPAGGEITLFDRSWYNRAGVEPVMGYCTLEERDAFLKAVPEFEGHLVEDGSCYSNIGCAATRSGRRKGSRTASATRSSAGNFRRSIFARATATMPTPRLASGCFPRLTPTSLRGPWLASMTRRTDG